MRMVMHAHAFCSEQMAEHMSAYRYSRLETGQGWTLKALLRPYEALFKPLIGSLEPLAVHPWAQEFWYAAI